MMTLPPAESTMLAASPLLQGEGGMVLKKPSVSGGVSTEAWASMPSGQGAALQPGLLFSALIPSTVAQGPKPEFSRLLQIALPGVDAVARDDALAGLAAEADDLVTCLMTSPGTNDVTEAVAQFVELLQQFDAATGGNATEVLTANLAGSDDEGLAKLDTAAADPAALVAALAPLAGIPGASRPPVVVSSLLVAPANPIPPNVAIRPPVFTPDLRHDGEVTPLRWGAAPSVEPLPDVFSVQKQSAGPAEPLLSARALVTAALFSAGTGGERDAVPPFASSSEARSVGVSMPEVSRPADPSPPPAFGFARNVAQQIRGASFLDGHTRIALAPRGLGEIEIDMRADESGKLRIVLRAENPAVLQALRGDRDGLLLALADGGESVDDADLEFEDFSRRQQRHDNPAEVSPDRGADTAPEKTSLLTAPPPRTIGAGLLDILT